MSTGMNRRSSRTYASRLDDEWQLDTNWTAKPTWKVEQIFFCISILYRHLSRHFYCFCITTGWIFVPSVVWLMELGLLLLPSQKSCFRHDQDTCNDNSLNTIAWLLLPRKKYKKWAGGTRKWQLSTLILSITVSYCLKITQNVSLEFYNLSIFLPFLVLK